MTRSHEKVHKSIFGATELLIYSKSSNGEKMKALSEKIRKLLQVKVSGGGSSHPEKNQFEVVQHTAAQFQCIFTSTTTSDKRYADLTC